jgi:hypothetical protein
MVDGRHLILLPDAVDEGRTEAWATPAQRGHRLAVIVIAGVAAATLVATGLAGATGASAPMAIPGADTHLIEVQRAHQTKVAAVTAKGSVVPTATETSPTTGPTPTVVITPTPPTPAVVPATVVTTPTPVPAPAAAPAPVSSVASLVAEVEAAGIAPGPNWTWSIGATTVCGTIPSSSGNTGCTFGAVGAVRTVFSGSPTLALVAHELANAETENDASPSLMGQVTAAEAGTSWSGIDAVASCLVAHFMGFQDQAAGAWQCPAPLASTVAATIHG